jgi:hypothetical protein
MCFNHPTFISKMKELSLSFLLILFATPFAFGQINEFKKVLPVENAPNYKYGSKISFAGGLGIITTEGPCKNGTGFSSFSCGRTYVVKRDFIGKWSLLNFFEKPPAQSNESEIRYGSSIATDGSSFVIGRMEGAQGLYSPALDVYQANGSGQIFFIKQVNYTFGGDFSPESSTSVEYPIAMASGLLVAGSPNDPNRNPLNGDVISSGRVLVYNKDLGGVNNWGLLKTLEAPAPFGSTYGSSVAASSNYIIAGAAPINSVYLYSKDLGGTNNWGLVKEISPADNTAGDSFGYSIAVSSDLIVVGAPNDDDKGTDSGSIYIFGKDQGGANNWGLVKKIVPTDGVAGDQFGYSVSLVNSDLVVGAPSDDDNGSNSGSMYHFSKDSGGANNWGLVSKLTKPSGTYTEDRFGTSVAIDSDELFTGIPFDDMQGVNSGAVALFKKSSNVFGYVNQWSASRAARNASFGYSVAITNQLAMVNNDFIFSKDFPTTNAWGLVKGSGTEMVTALCYNQIQVDLGEEYAFRADGAACKIFEEGAVVVMNKDQGGSNNWGDIKTITPTSATQYGVFGWKSAAFQDILVANAYKNVNGGTGQETGDTKGEVYVFGKDVGGINNWGQVKKITATNGQMGDYFGFDLAVENNVLAIATPGFTSNQGAVFIHYQNQGGANNWGLLKRIDTPDGGTNDEFGKSIYLINGTDLVISAPGNSSNAGAVYLFRKDQGGADTWGLIKKITSPVAKANGRFGKKVSLSTEGLVVSDNDQDVYVFLANEGGVNNYGYSGKLLPTDFSASDAFGASFSILDNVVFVGAPAQTNALGSGVGAAYLFYTPPPSPILNTATSLTSSSFSISWNAVTGVSGYKVDISTTPNFASFVGVYNGFTTAQTSLNLSSLVPNQNYYVRVKSVRLQGGDSKQSTTISALTAPAVPTANAATLMEATSFTANWSAVTGATSYTIELLNDDNTAVAGYPKSVATVNSNITGLASGKVYKYRVSAFNGTSSALSNQISVLLKPAPPVALNALNIITGGFKAVWNSVTGADSYELDVATSQDFSTFLTGYNSKTIAVLEETLSDLNTAQTNYWYRVRAVNASGKSIDSNTINLTTPAAPNSVALSLSAPLVSGSKISVNVTGGSGTRLVKFYSKKITAANNTYVEKVLTSATDAYETTVSTDDFDELGLEYYFTALDGSVTTPVETVHGYIYQTVGLNTFSAIPFSTRLNGSAGTYEMFSVPYEITEKSIASNFDELGAPDKTQWRLLRYQGGKYIEYPDNITTLDIGKGYWFNALQKVDIKTGEGKVTSANQTTPFTITFAQGWNQIGNPYPFNIDWEAMKNANTAAGLNSLWLFEGGKYIKKDVLATWKGAFVFSDTGGSVSFPVTAKTTSPGRTAKEELTPTLDEASWQLPIKLSLNGLEQISAVGMHPEARASKDKFDEITIPRFIDYLEMNTYHEEFFAHHFASDMVTTTNETSWLFTVSSNQKEGVATLTWNQQALVSNLSKIALIDLHEQTLVDMKTTNTYQFNWSEGRQFKILYSREGELLPGVTMLGNAYPNPFTTGTIIPILLEEDQTRVEVSIYDLLGRKVKTLSKPNSKAGIHTIEWNGNNELGSMVDGGLYLYQLRGDKGILSPPKRLIKQ